jgi:hypothetical protein
VASGGISRHSEDDVVGVVVGRPAGHRLSIEASLQWWWSISSWSWSRGLEVAAPDMDVVRLGWLTVPVYIAEIEIRDAEVETAPGIGEPARWGSWLRHVVICDVLDVTALMVKVELHGQASAAVTTERSRHCEAACASDVGLQ